MESCQGKIVIIFFRFLSERASNSPQLLVHHLWALSLPTSARDLPWHFMIYVPEFAGPGVSQSTAAKAGTLTGQPLSEKTHCQLGTFPWPLHLSTGTGVNIWEHVNHYTTTQQASENGLTVSLLPSQRKACLVCRYFVLEIRNTQKFGAPSNRHRLFVQWKNLNLKCPTTHLKFWIRSMANFWNPTASIVNYQQPVLRL